MAKKKRLRVFRKRLMRGAGMKRLKVWKSSEWLGHAKNEFDDYKRTGDKLKLAQAGENLWSAFGLKMDERFGRKFFGYMDLEDVIVSSGDRELSDIARDAYWLHVFFYRGWTEDVRIEEGKWHNVFNWLKGRK
jgi:hypothetical protein